MPKMSTSCGLSLSIAAGNRFKPRNAHGGMMSVYLHPYTHNIRETFIIRTSNFCFQKRSVFSLELVCFAHKLSQREVCGRAHRKPAWSINSSSLSTTKDTFKTDVLHDAREVKIGKSKLSCHNPTFPTLLLLPRLKNHQGAKRLLCFLISTSHYPRLACAAPTRYP